MTTIDDEILDDLFLGCAFSAFVQQARLQESWPDSETTRQLAYRMYEDALTEIHSQVGRIESSENASTVTQENCNTSDNF